MPFLLLFGFNRGTQEETVLNGTAGEASSYSGAQNRNPKLTEGPFVGGPQHLIAYHPACFAGLPGLKIHTLSGFGTLKPYCLRTWTSGQISGYGRFQK